MLYARVCLTGGHVIWEYMSFRMTCIMGAYVVGRSCFVEQVLREDVSCRSACL